MKCPKCEEKIEKVDIFSESRQEAELKRNKIIEYGPVLEVGITMYICCPECGEDITKYIKE